MKNPIVGERVTLFLPMSADHGAEGRVETVLHHNHRGEPVTVTVALEHGERTIPVHRDCLRPVQEATA